MESEQPYLGGGNHITEANVDMANQSDANYVNDGEDTTPYLRVLPTASRQEKDNGCFAIETKQE